MRNALKIAKWEIQKNIKNKTFIIGIIMTPALFLLFSFIGSLVNSSDEEKTLVYVNDQVGAYEALKETAKTQHESWKLEKTDVSKEEAAKLAEKNDDAVYLFLDKQSVEQGNIPYYAGADVDDEFAEQSQILSGPLKAVQLKQAGLTDQELAAIAKPIQFEKEQILSKEENDQKSDDFLKKFVPGIVGGILFLSILFNGMQIFQSASSEKKEKIAEIILSSITPSQLMQGKIIGYFVLGMIQAFVYLAAAIGIAIWKWDPEVLSYVLVPQTLLFVFIAILGYFLFAALYVGLGATVEDMSSTNNMQGLVMMLPFLAFPFIGPIFSDPEGMVAQVGSYVPFTAPAVLIMRLAVLEVWPWAQIAISLAILAVSIVFLMYAAGKIFRIGIMMYGKNATPKEIIKWLRA